MRLSSDRRWPYTLACQFLCNERLVPLLMLFALLSSTNTCVHVDTKWYEDTWWHVSATSCKDACQQQRLVPLLVCLARCGGVWDVLWWPMGGVMVYGMCCCLRIQLLVALPFAHRVAGHGFPCSQATTLARHRADRETASTVSIRSIEMQRFFAGENCKFAAEAT